MAGNGITQRQKKFIAAMLLNPTIEKAARAAGIGERTAYKYMANPIVKRALSQALDATLTQATGRAVTAMGGALDTLVAIHTDTTAPAGARVSAARAIQDGGPKLREGQDLADRVAALEERLGGKE